MNKVLYNFFFFFLSLVVSSSSFIRNRLTCFTGSIFYPLKRTHIFFSYTFELIMILGLSDVFRSKYPHPSYLSFVREDIYLLSYFFILYMASTLLYTCSLMLGTLILQIVFSLSLLVSVFNFYLYMMTKVPEF